jgi:hypothetical protein
LAARTIQASCDSFRQGWKGLLLQQKHLLSILKRRFAPETYAFCSSKYLPPNVERQMTPAIFCCQIWKGLCSSKQRLLPTPSIRRHFCSLHICSNLNSNSLLNLYCHLKVQKLLHVSKFSLKFPKTLSDVRKLGQLSGNIVKCPEID